MKFARSSLILLAFLAVGALAANHKPTPRANYCQACKSIVSFAQKLNSSNDRAEYKDVLVNYCELYNPKSSVYQPGPCSLFVSGFYMLMDHMDPIYHCDQIGACNSNDNSFGSNMKIDKPSRALGGDHDFHQSPRASKMVCEYCEQIVEQTQATFTNPKNIDRIRHQVDAFCDYMQVIGEDKNCRQVAARYLDQALDFVRNIDPLEYCKRISLCSPAAKVKNSKSTLNQLPTLTDFNNFGIETSVSIGEASSAVPAASGPRVRNNQVALGSSYQNGPACSICKTVVKEMFNFLRDNKTEENIIEGLDKICQIIYPRGPKLEQCDEMVKSYTRELVLLLIDETDPEMICILLGECDQHNAYPVKRIGAHLDRDRFGLSELITALDPSIEIKSSRACLECKLFINYLKSTLEEAGSRDFVKGWLHEHLCADLSGDLAQQCDQMVDQYADIFFKAIIGHLEPTSACVELQVCPKARFGGLLIVDAAPGASGPSVYRDRQLRTSLGSRPSPKPLRGAICDQCVSIISQFDEYLSSHPVDQDVSVLVENVCKKLPEGSMRTECSLIIESMGSELVQLIANMKSPRDLCAKMLLC